MCTLHACGDVKVFRTLDERLATASLHSATSKRKNVPCFFVFSRGWIFSENGKDIFLFGVLPRSFWAGGEAKANSVTAQRPLQRNSPSHLTVARLVSLPFPLFRSALASPPRILFCLPPIQISFFGMVVAGEVGFLQRRN